MPQERHGAFPLISASPPPHSPRATPPVLKIWTFTGHAPAHVHISFVLSIFVRPDRPRASHTVHILRTALLKKALCAIFCAKTGKGPSRPHADPLGIEDIWRHRVNGTCTPLAPLPSCGPPPVIFLLPLARTTRPIPATTERSLHLLVLTLNCNYARKEPMKSQTFGNRLRELRKARDLSQRELAKMVNLDFTYLSKIENDRMPPPSAAAITNLASELNADKDELLALAGKVPKDIGETYRKSEGARMFLRSATTRKLTEQDWKRLLQNLDRKK